MDLALIRSALLAFVLTAGSLFGAGMGIQDGSVQAKALPDCRYADVATKHSAYSDWKITLVDTIYKVGPGYRPPDLVKAKRAGIGGGGLVRKVMINDLADMARAAKGAGARLRVVSAYRSYASQKVIYKREVRLYGKYRARRSSARPGHSEHQLGTTIDFGAADRSADTNQKFGKTAAGKWMKANAWKYGFVMSYPKGQTSKTCYFYEPWHYRYVGRTLAAKIHASGLTTREYLWRHYN